MEFARAQGVDLSAGAPAPKAAQPVPSDFREFLMVVKIRTKRGGKLIHPVLNDEQEQLLAAWEAGDADGLRHLLVVKPRKIGVTTLFALLFLHQWLISPDPITLVCLANTRTVAEEIMQMMKTGYWSLPPEMRPKLTTNQAKKMAREDPVNPGVDGATLFVATARADRPLAGFTPYWLHVSEAAHVKNPNALRAAAFSSVPWEEGGRIVLESTPAHVGDLLHEEIQKSQAGLAELPWRPMFFAWWAHSTYRAPAVDFVRTVEEERLVERYGVDNEQLAWRRTQVATTGPDFPREYPADLEDAYSAIEGAWFHRRQLEHLEVFDLVGEQGRPWVGTLQLEPYDPRETYGAAVDCGAGVGGDATTCVILKARTKRPVALYRSVDDPPPTGADEVWHLLCQYGHAKVLVERNRYGIPYLDALRALRANMYEERNHETDGQREAGEPRDFVTNERTRVEVLNGFRTHVLSGALPMVDSVCRDEMMSAKVKDGQIVFPRSVKAGHGDVLMTYALALRCLTHVPLPEVGPTPGELRERELARQKLLAGAAPGRRY